MSARKKADILLAKQAKLISRNFASSLDCHRPWQSRRSLIIVRNAGIDALYPNTKTSVFSKISSRE